MTATSPPLLTTEPISGRATLATCASIMIPILLNLLDGLTTVVTSVLFPLLLLLLLLLFIATVVKGFPRWSLPLAGFLLALVGFLTLISLLQWLAPDAAPLFKVKPGDENGRLMSQVLMSGLMWLLFGLLVAVIVFLTALVPPWRFFYRRVRQDWTLLSFLAYGAALLTVAFAFDEYRYEKPYLLGSMVFMVAGAWLYLQSPRPRQRWLALLAGVALAMTTIAVGKWVIVPLQNWPLWLQWHPPEIERRFESFRTLFESGWIVAILLVPALIQLLPPTHREAQT